MYAEDNNKVKAAYTLNMWTVSISQIVEYNDLNVSLKFLLFINTYSSIYYLIRFITIFILTLISFWKGSVYPRYYRNQHIKSRCTKIMQSLHHHMNRDTGRHADTIYFR